MERSGGRGSPSAAAGGPPPRDQGHAEPGLLGTLVGDGTALLNLTAVALLFSGAFALYLTVTGQLLPHDLHFLQLSAAELCAHADCRINAFMFHDRAAFGGALIAVGVLYLWLVAFPLRAGEPWAWWTIAATGGVGFLSFLAWLGYGYLDSWHAVGTVALLPVFGAGLQRTRSLARSRRDARGRSVFAAARGRERLAMALLLATAAGMVLAGATILAVGMTRVFVPDDLAFIGLGVEELRSLSPGLVPLIAHDRAGFGGGLLTTGLLVGSCVWHAPLERALRQALWTAGIAGFGCAIGVHLLVGYTIPSHLAPAVAGAGLFGTGMLLATPRRTRGSLFVAAHPPMERRGGPR